jgi:drug/metabolite transporter (DMT)-like permease
MALEIVKMRQVIISSKAKGEHVMSITRIIGIVLIIAGTAGLVYGGFSFTKETHHAELGPLEFEIEEKETVAVPTWVGAGAIGLGVVLLLVGGGRTRK